MRDHQFGRKHSVSTACELPVGSLIEDALAELDLSSQRLADFEIYMLAGFIKQSVRLENVTMPLRKNLHCSLEGGARALGDVVADLSPLSRLERLKLSCEVPASALRLQRLITMDVRKGRVGAVEAVVDHVTHEMRLFHEEQFGPVMPIARFGDVEEVKNAIKSSWNGQQVRRRPCATGRRA